MVHRRTASKYHRELVIALESARTRLAIAIAAETKSTPPDRRQHYLETADRARRFIKRLRHTNHEIVLDPRMPWTEIVESIRHLPAQSEAKHVCKLLGDIVAELDGK